MNRAERRRQGKSKEKEPVYQMTASQLQAIKKDIADRSTEAALVFMLAIPTMIIHDKFGQLMKKDGREERFCQLCYELFETYQQGYVSMTDLHQCLLEEANIQIKGLDVHKLMRLNKLYNGSI